jgi:hypothetical protein
MALLEDENRTQHFLGPLVCTPNSHVPGRIAEYQLIDGQQRLTTLVLLLCALRDVAKQEKLNELSEEISEDFLVHKRKSGLERYKILPRLNERSAVIGIVDGQLKKEYQRFQVTKALTYFRKAIGKVAAEQLSALLTAIADRLSLVVITIEGENPYEIFDSLNSTGLPLAESDLIRNFVFMQVPTSEQEAFNSQFWDGLEARFGDEKLQPKALTAFYRCYLMRNGDYSKPKSAFVDFREQNRQRNLDPKTQAQELLDYADVYCWGTNPCTCENGGLQKHLTNLNQLDVPSTYPLVVNMIHKWQQESVSTDDLFGMLSGLQSFILRRAICGDSTRQYNRWFCNAIKVMQGDPRTDLQSLWIELGWPTDSRFIEALRLFPLYRSDLKRCRLVLWGLEASYGHKERVDPESLTVEHVMPQSISNNENGRQWQEILGADWFEVHQAQLHTLGNLTLTGYNAEMSNRPYEAKQSALSDSNLVLNRYFRDVPVWNDDAISMRGRKLGRETANIWPCPMQSSAEPEVPSIPNAKVDRFDTAELRKQCVERFEVAQNQEFIEESPAKFIATQGSTRFVCLASKPYEEKLEVRYWYGFTPEQNTFLEEAKSGFIGLGCGSPDRLLVFPSEKFATWLSELRETEGNHWHVEVFRADATYELELSKTSRRVDVSSFLLAAGSSVGS